MQALSSGIFDVVAHCLAAVQTASSLGSLTRCGDADALLAAVAPPEDPTARAEVDAMRERLAAVTASATSGQFKQALGDVTTLREDASALGYGPLLAEVLLAQGHARELNGDYAGAGEVIEEALWTADAAGHDEVRAEAVAMLIHTRGVRAQQREGLDAWDALHAALPVGTVSGAPKIRAMQIIDELEPVKRGPYGGGLGYVGLDGQMDIALALRTIVVPTKGWDANSFSHEWCYHVQAGAGVVLDSVPESEYRETIAKAGALAQAIELADSAFG